MANEISYELGATGSTLYAVARNAAGQAWNGSAFATYTTTRGDFDIPLSEVGTTGFYGPANLPGTGTGRWWQIYLQAGGSPSHTDDVLLATGYHTIGGIAGTIDTLDALDTAQDSRHDTTQITLGENADGIDDANSAIALVAADVAATLADTNELQTDWANGGRLDVILDARASQASVDGLELTAPAQVHNNEPVPARTAKLGSWADGVTKAHPRLRVRPGQITQLWIDCSKQVNANLADVTNGASSSAEFTITSLGMYGKHVSVLVDATEAEDTDVTTLTCDVTPTGTQSLPVAVDVVADAD